MAESEAFFELHEGVRQWIWNQGWTCLRDIQEQAISPILEGERDLLISATTAAGKTEAAFMPACSAIAGQGQGIGILYISPLKALINDQFRRLQSLCDCLDLPLTPWHGDVVQSRKRRQREKPHGVLLITPESLESLLIRRLGWCAHAFAHLRYLIIDEYHVFPGSERGCQLASILHRLEYILEKPVPRIALSATIKDPEDAMKALRPDRSLPCQNICSSALKSDLKLQLRGYRQPASDSEEPSAFQGMVHDLFRLLRGGSHLVFANSRNRTEQLAAALTQACERNGVPNEFFPHHGNLSKEIRESLEVRLQREKLPTTAICTMTLELGIDIGKVDSIAQVTAPHSVASLRQRVGRSGRRGDAALLRLFIPENELNEHSSLQDQLRLQTVQSVAMVNLLLEKWCEPLLTGQFHFSTLLQQTLAVIAQYGGVRANQLWTLLCDTGPFSNVNQEMYAQLLRAFGESELITQTDDGQLVLGVRGERMVDHYTFYTAFKNPEEYTLLCEGKVLGSLPILSPLIPDQHLIFAGEHWRVLEVDATNKRVYLGRAKGGKPPLFDGSNLMVHDRIRREMRRVYKNGLAPIFLDPVAKALFLEGVDYFHLSGLESSFFFQAGTKLFLLPWLGDAAVNTLVMLIRREGFRAEEMAGIIEIEACNEALLKDHASRLLAEPRPIPRDLATIVPDTIVEKHDPFIPKPLQELEYGTRFFDIDGALSFLETLA